MPWLFVAGAFTVVAPLESACSDDATSSSVPPAIDGGVTVDGASPPPVIPPVQEAGVDAGPVGVPDEACPLAAKTWMKSDFSGAIRSIVIRNSVYAIADDAKTNTMPLHAFGLASGEPAPTSTRVECPPAEDVLFFPRLQTARFDGAEQLFVSFPNASYAGPDGIIEAPGGLERVGPLDSPMPESVSFLEATRGSVDGIFDSASGPLVLSWDALSSADGTLATLVGAAGSESLTNTQVFPSSASVVLRSEPLYFDGQLVALLRATGLDDPSAVVYSGWPLLPSGPGEAVELPGGYVTAALHDEQPFAYGLSSNGELVEVGLTASLTPTQRVVARLPQGYTVAPGAIAQMAYTNGSVVLPAYKDGAPRILRVRLGTGSLDEWVAVIPDGAAFLGWSALAAGHGVVCTAMGTNEDGVERAGLHCGCLDGAFSHVP